jgi:hypothetical protein
MLALPEIPTAKRRVLDSTIEALKGISNVAAVVLGGSYARGLANESSDLDIGVYYQEFQPLAVHEVCAVADSICTAGSHPVVTELYGWGPWVNGGAWIQTPATKVDLIYRNLEQVRSVIEEGQRGVCRHDFDQQPPFGFRSVVYFGETRYCIPLHDPMGLVAQLKALVAVYPEPMKNTIIHESLWGAEFSIWSCDQFAASADVYNAAGCMTRAAQFIVQALFAINEEYFLNDKHVNRILASFAQAPGNCAERLADILSRPGRDACELRASLDSLCQLWSEVVGLTKGTYQPRFNLATARTIQSSSFSE